MVKQEVSASRRLVRVLALSIVWTICGCADVRVVRETSEGGVVALPMNTNCWPMYYRDRAEKLMSQKCPAGYRIDREEFVWNGKEGPEGHRYYESYFGYTNPDDDRADYLRKEYRITFHAAPSGSQRPPTSPPLKPGQSNSSAPPPSRPKGESNEELPPPRLFKGVQE
ncbi:MAG TPA: hypothetical protein VH643_37125 [Gemmataceae bacterium]|jgi:hypothetical protein